jgi:hypothetical protein
VVPPPVAGIAGVRPMSALSNHALDNAVWRRSGTHFFAKDTDSGEHPRHAVERWLVSSSVAGQFADAPWPISQSVRDPKHGHNVERLFNAGPFSICNICCSGSGGETRSICVDMLPLSTRRQDLTCYTAADRGRQAWVKAPHCGRRPRGACTRAGLGGVLQPPFKHLLILAAWPLARVGPACRLCGLPGRPRGLVCQTLSTQLDETAYGRNTLLVEEKQ